MWSLTLVVSDVTEMPSEELQPCKPLQPIYFLNISLRSDQLQQRRKARLRVAFVNITEHQAN